MKAVFFLRAGLLPAALAVLLSACGGTPPPAVKKEPAKAPEPVTGLKAFFQMYSAARPWAADLVPLGCHSQEMTGIPSGEGKYPLWNCTFVSESRRQSKTYTYAVANGDGGINKGIYGRNEESYSGPRGNQSPFPMQALKKDTDEALKLALATKDATEYVKKNPDKPVFFMLEKTKELQNPAWRVVWGTSISTSNFSIYVDASTGDYIKTMR
ncbi:MAG: hypothetical protein IT163_02560 [Bryobacterales bacterium]|nr:hypothetical protein [Bryobacterales bacterium]